LKDLYHLKRTHLCGVLNKSDLDQKVVLAGWVKRRRDHGGLIFVDLGDKTGITQVVFNPEIDKEAQVTHRGNRGAGGKIGDFECLSTPSFFYRECDQDE